MNWHELTHWFQVKRNGTVVRTTENISHTESIDQLTQTSSFTLIDQETFAGNTPVTIEHVDFDAGITRIIFAGTYDASEVESGPQEVTIQSTGKLALLRNARRVADGDFQFNGMTDGEVVEYILDYCGISLADTDIEEAGYTLGAHADLFWRVGESGATIISEIDAVFGSKTLEVGDQIVRRFYDLAPTGSLAYRDYVKGEDYDLWAAHRSYGRRDEIQSAWTVRGVSTPCGPADACTCTPYARARDSNPAIGSSRFQLGMQTFDSDLIQSSELAESIVRRLMRWYNRRPDTIALTALVDKNIHPTTVIGYTDPTPHIDAEEVRYYTVTTVDRSLFDQTLQAVGGVAGEEGSVTSGTEMICDRTESDGGWDDSYTDPDTSVPPVDDGDPFGDMPDIDDFGEVTPPEPPDVTSPFINCAETDGMVGTVSEGSINEEGLATWATVENAVWRPDLETSIGVHLTDGVIDEFRFWDDRTMFLNLTPGFYDDKDAADDETLGNTPLLSVSGEMWWKEPPASGSDSSVYWYLHRASGVAHARAEFYPDPGIHNTIVGGTQPHDWAVRARGEHEAAKTDDRDAAGVCRHTVFRCNNGGFMGKDAPLPTGVWVPFTVGFDLSTELHRVDVTAGDVGGYFADPPCWGPSCEFDTGYSVSAVNHKLAFLLSDLPGGGNIADPKIKIRNIQVGYDTCVPNPDYIPPERE